MPVEIRELVIKTSINDNESVQRKGKTEDINSILPEIKEDIINECCLRIVDQIKSSNER